MLFLGIETSCDETAAAVVRDGSEVLSSVIASQAELHAETGGIVPEVAAREHVGAILPVIEQALQGAEANLDELDAIAVTYGPGLASSLMTGVVTANTLATFLEKPLVGVNHIFGHIRSNWLFKRIKDKKQKIREFKYPIVILTASGGHNELVLLESENSAPKVIGETNDDAAGEAFDKVARLLGLSYPGGPAIEQQVTQCKIQDLKCKIKQLPRAWLMPKDQARNFDSVEVGRRLRNGKMQLTSFDFSFSGLKSEVRRRVQAGEFGVVEMAFEFQEAVVDVLATKLFLAAQKFQAKEIHLAGGVSANRRLRERIVELAKQLKIQTRGPHPGSSSEEERVTIRWPERMSYCTDNAAMIAGAGWWLHQQDPNLFQQLKLLDVEPGLSL